MECIFKVPEHVLLPEDIAQRTKYSTKGHRKILKEIENIKMEIQAVIQLAVLFLLSLQGIIIMILGKVQECCFPGEIERGHRNS